MTVAAENPNISPLARSVTSLRGVGPERAKQLERLDIRTVEDLLFHRPRRYEDRRHLEPIAGLREGKTASVRGKVVAMGIKYFRQRTRSIFEIVLNDGSARLHCRWWNLPFMEKYFAVGNEVIAFGRVVDDKPRTMDHPETEVVENEGEGGDEELVHFNRITPVYPLTEGLPQRWLRGLIWRMLQNEPMSEEGPTETTGVTVPLTPTFSPRRGRNPGGDQLGVVRMQNAGNNGSAARDVSLLTLPPRAQAIRDTHFPQTLEDIEPARRRLALDEFVALQKQMQLRRRNFETKSQALPCHGDNRLIKPFLARLGFKLTAAQTRVLRELRKDMSAEHPMRRLLQGDVGSGKTAVAACCALMALESGYHVALMAPTEILAEQHYANFKRWFEPLGIPVELQTGSHKTQPVQSPNESLKSEVSSLKSGSDSEGAFHASRITHYTSLTIGTHALIESGFVPENLGLVIIDEQHRFGVAQREKLVKKGHYPHLLTMTATPIPRTLGLTLYGELEVSVIDELPPCRGLSKTFVRGAEKLPQVWSFIAKRLREGRQAFVVYPRVEETGEGLKAVTKEFSNVQAALKPFRVGLMHGRLKPAEKEAVMAAFRANRIQALLATSLIEVGVDVPNATVMLVENAEQFGLAQLHQLRGRIGRGAADSYCILIASAKSREARERLRVLEETNDGFKIAEADLKLRGPGEMLGQEQSGMPRFRFGDLANDLELIELARDLVKSAG